MRKHLQALGIRERLRASGEDLTPSERQLSAVLLENYPFVALGTVAGMAEAGGVSAPTVLRMVRKLGFTGFPEFQAQVRQEVGEAYLNPITKHDRLKVDVPETHLLNRFGDAVLRNMRDTLDGLEPAEFDAVVDLLGDRSRHIYIVGGRITNALAQHLFTHLQVIRDKVTRLDPNPGSWPHFVLDMKAGDAMLIFDIRRYGREVETLAKVAKAREMPIVLFTDRWTSPVARQAAHVLKCEIEVPSAWDSCVVMLFLVEALVEAVQSRSWEATKDRIGELETLFAATPLFLKPPQYPSE